VTYSAGEGIVVLGSNGYEMVYWHLSSRSVPVGVWVSQGQTLGYSGTAGGVNHIHFEVRHNGKQTDTMGWYSGPDPCPGLPAQGTYKGCEASIWLWSDESPPIPVAPSNLSASAVSPCQINLSWRDNSNYETGFKIYRNGSYIAAVGANVTSYKNTGLSCGTIYSYYVKAYNSRGTSGASNTASATTHSCPAAPSNLSASAVSPSQINLSWKDNSNNETGFKIYRAGSLIATVGANVTSYQNTGLTCGTSYSYYVKAYNCGGVSGASNTASAATYPCTPSAPSNLSALAVSQSQIDLSWQDNSNNETGFKIYRDDSHIATVGANVTSYQDTDLGCATTYSYYVKAYNSAGDSGPSNTANATTFFCKIFLPLIFRNH